MNSLPPEQLCRTTGIKQVFFYLMDRPTVPPCQHLGARTGTNQETGQP